MMTADQVQRIVRVKATLRQTTTSRNGMKGEWAKATSVRKPKVMSPVAGQLKEGAVGFKII